MVKQLIKDFLQEFVNEASPKIEDKSNDNGNINIETVDDVLQSLLEKFVKDKETQQAFQGRMLKLVSKALQQYKEEEDLFWY